MKIINADCLEVMKDMDADSMDSIVTDPPYGLKFMGKDWDHGVPGVRFWEAALRVAKPGAHLLAFGGTRTFHRLAVAIEDAGWVIRETVGWIYGSGFPKSHNIGKAIDKAAGVEFSAKPAEGVGFKRPDGRDGYNVTKNQLTREGESTEAAKQWDGWGTALKPAWEPVIVARKPFKGTVAANVLEHGTGAINIDECRVEGEEVTINTFDDGMKPFGDGAGHPYTSRKVQGRWPANIIHDGSEKVMEVFPTTKSGKMTAGTIRKKSKGLGGYNDNFPDEATASDTYGDQGSAARFFYCAKASKKERNMGLDGMEENRKAAAEFRPNHMKKAENGEDGSPFGRWGKIKNNHPTVKPIALMRYLCRLVTPSNGTVFDPFMGSGSTGVAAVQERFEFIGCDIEKEYVEIAKKRIENTERRPNQLEMDV